MVKSQRIGNRTSGPRPGRPFGFTSGHHEGSNRSLRPDLEFGCPVPPVVHHAGGSKNAWQDCGL